MPFATAEAATTCSPQLLKAELAAGNTVFLDFKASWCSTCAAQDRVINALRKVNPACDQTLRFITVDWDQ
jgi:thioredoxin 1